MNLGSHLLCKQPQEHGHARISIMLWSLRKLLTLSSLRFRPPRREWFPAHLRLVQEPPKVWESWILIADAKSVSRERILILDAKPVRRPSLRKSPPNAWQQTKSLRLVPL